MGNKSSSTMRQEQAEKSRQKLLDSAQELFAEQGYKGTSVRSINRNIGLADGLLYHYFPGGKKEIFQAIVVKNLSNMMDIMEVRNTVADYDNMPIEELINQVFLSFEEVTDLHIDILRILFREPEAREIITHEQITKLFENRQRWFPAILERRIKTGEINEIDCESAAVVLNAIMMNHLMAKVLELDSARMCMTELRTRLINYQVGLWKGSGSKIGSAG